MPVPLPEHLPDRLTITLWDFTWYTRTGEGEPFHDLDTAFADAVERGYNTVRICAMPFLLFGSGLDTTELTFAPFGNGWGLGTRWYDVRQTTVLDGRAHLLALFRAARRHNCYVILSSWEYQQSSSFVTERAWFDALMAVDPERRAEVLADALADLIDFLAGEGLDDRVAFTEIHNEVQGGHLTDGLPVDVDPVLALRPRLQRAVDRFHERHPARPVTVNYARVPAGAMRGIPDRVDVGVFHPYVYGVLDELLETFALRTPAMSLELRTPAGDFPVDRLRAELLRPGAPDPQDWAPELPWRREATIVGQREVYTHDWCDPQRWDRWLYERYAVHRSAMEQLLITWLEVAADWSATRGVPWFLGEGWIGYTPLAGNFEEGPVGAEFCRLAVREARRLGARGTVVCSNAAPHHPMWNDIALHQECTKLFAA